MNAHPTPRADPEDSAERSDVNEDAVSRLVHQWREVAPELDLAPIEVIARIHRLSGFFSGVDGHLQPVGLNRGEFDLLGTLRRLGGELTPSDLARERRISPAAVTKRLKTLQSRGLVVRRVDERDRRVLWVAATEAGVALHAEHFARQLAAEHELLEALGEQREILVKLLGDLTAHLERRLPEPR